MDLVDEDLYLSEDGLEATVTPTAPPDIGTLYVRLRWPEDDVPQRWTHMLQKALQSWFNTALAEEIRISCNIHRLEPLVTPGCAVVAITPFSALDVLLSKKSFSLKFKELKQTAVVYFYSSADMINTAKVTNATENTEPLYSSGQEQIPMKVNAVVDVKKLNSQVQAEVMKKFEKNISAAHRLSMQGTLEEVNVFYADLRQTVTQKAQRKNNVSLSAVPSETSAAEEKGSQDVTCRVPLSQYLSACQTYRKEMEMIERENSVRIQPEVTLSFINNGTGRDMRSKACQDLTKLIQNCVGSACSQADLPAGKNLPLDASASASQFLVPKIDASSHSRGLDCPQENSSGKAGQISVEVGRRKGQTEGDVKNQENVFPIFPPVSVDISTRTGRLDEATTIDGVSQIAAQEHQEATQPACRQGFGNANWSRRRRKGDQPKGKMTIHAEKESLPGFLGYGTIVINYDIPSAVQANDHPNPGKPFQGLQVTAYLPDSPEGKHVVYLLKKAFSQRLVFTVGVSNNTGRDGCVIWNGIAHKTSKYGGRLSNGYPDPHYIEQVKRELKEKGIE